MPFRFWDRIRDWVILVTLMLCSVVVMLAQNEPMLRGLRALSLETTSWMEARFAWMGHFFRALEENEMLREENIEYSSQLARLREARLENERLRRMLALQDTTTYPMLAAQIIGKDHHLEYNFLTLDVGRADSVETGMAVVNERGILGKIVFVSEHYSRVMPYRNTKFRVPAKVQPLQASGMIRWPGTGALSDVILLEYVVKTEPVETGMRVVTSGYSSVFPPGYPIGVIDSVVTQRGKNTWELHVRPAASLNTADYAFVILRKPDPERLELEAQRIE